MLFGRFTCLTVWSPALPALRCGSRFDVAMIFRALGAEIRTLARYSNRSLPAHFEGNMSGYAIRGSAALELPTTRHVSSGM